MSGGQIEAANAHKTAQGNKRHAGHTPNSPPQAVIAAPQPIIIKVEPTADEVEAVAEHDSAKSRIFGVQPDAWVAYFTFALTIATGLMWIATERNASAAFRAAKVAESALMDLERPYVFLRFGNPGFERKPIEEKDSDNNVVYTKFIARYSGQFERLFVNFGRSPAILTEIFDNFDPTAGLTAMPYPVDPKLHKGIPFPVGTISASGDPHGVFKSTYLAFNKRRLTPDEFENTRFFCNGYIRYEDVVGGKYILGYCARFDPIRATWVLEGGNEFNYTQVERDPRSQKPAKWRRWLRGEKNA